MSKEKKIFEFGLEILLEAFAIYLAYRVNQLSGLKTAILVFVCASYLFYRISSVERIWNTSSTLLNPARAAILISCSGIIYYGVKGVAFNQLLLIGLAFFIIGGAIGAFLTTYWEIGS